jgi:hypothetical protein
MEYTPSLEDFLQWEDNDDTVVVEGADPTIEENNEDVTEEATETEDTVQEESTTTTEENTTEEQPSTEESEGEEPSQISMVFDVMSKSGILNLPDDFKFDGSVEKLAEALELTEQNMQIKVAQNLWERLPENFRTLLEYGLSGGTDINSFKEVVNNQVDLSKVNLEKEEDQRAIVEAYLKKTTKLTQDKINKRVRVLYESDLLEDEASENLKELQAIQEEEKKNLVQQELERKKLEQEEIERAYTVFSDVTSKLDVNEERKKQIMKAVWETSNKYDGKNKISYVEHIDEQIRNNPEHFAQLVNIYLDYDPKVGFKNVGKGNKSAATAAAKNLRDTLQDLLNGNKVVQAVSNPTKGSSGFDFEQFIKYS